MDSAPLFKELRELGLRGFHPEYGPSISMQNDPPRVGERVHVRKTRHSKYSSRTYELLGHAKDPEFWEFFEKNQESRPTWMRVHGVALHFYAYQTGTGRVNFAHRSNMRRPLPTIILPEFARKQVNWGDCPRWVTPAYLQEIGEDA